MERLKRFQRMLEDKLRRWEAQYASEEMFGMPQHRYPELSCTVKEIAALDRLYTLYITATTKLAHYLAMSWYSLDLTAMVDELQKVQDSIRRLPPTVKHFVAYAEMKERVDDILELQPVFEQLAHPSIRERHWA